MWITFIILLKWLIIGSKGTVIEVEVLKAGEMGKRKDPSDFDMGQIVMENWVGASPIWHVLWGPGMGMQWSVPISSPRKDNWWTCDTAMDVQGSLMHVGSKH